jgi:hypothetical protein
MDHERATTLVPWLLNGSLASDEREQLMLHLRECEDCRAELGDTVATWEVFATHIPSADLVAWAAGETVTDPGVLAHHLEVCASCRDDLELLRSDLALEPLTWRGVRRTKPSRAAKSWRRASMALAAVAVLAVATAAILGWRLVSVDRVAGLRQQQLAADVSAVTAERDHLVGETTDLRDQVANLGDRLQALASPRLNIPVIELLPRGLVTRGTASPTVETVPTGVEVVTLLLAAHDLRPVDERALEVRDATENLVWRGSGLRLSEMRDYTVQLPVDQLPPGNLELVVLGRAGSRWIDLDRYQLRLPPRPIAE